MRRERGREESLGGEEVEGVVEVVEEMERDRLLLEMGWGAEVGAALAR